MYNEDYDCHSFFSADDCSECNEKDQTLDAAADYFKGVVEELYDDEHINCEKLMHCLQELGHLLKVKIPNKELTIHTKTRRENFLNDWVCFNNKFMNGLRM